MKYRVTISGKNNAPTAYYFEEEYLASALYRAAVLHEHEAYIHRIEKGRWVRV